MNNNEALLDKAIGSKMSEKSKLPEKFRVIFWDTDFDKLDLEANKYFIIARLYTKGNFDAIDWVHQTYTEKDIKETAKTRRSLDPIVANYLRKKYDLDKDEMAYYKFEKMGGHELWKY